VVVTEGKIAGFGQEIAAPGGKVSKKALAVFHDDAPPLTNTYSAMIDWGDGTKSPGVLRFSTPVAGGVDIGVFGTKTYSDNGTYSVKVDLTRDSGNATAWSRVTSSGLKTRTLPPFPVTNIGVLRSVLTQRKALISGTNYRYYVEGAIYIQNAGSLPAKNVKLRLYLSDDETLDTGADMHVYLTDGPTSQTLPTLPAIKGNSPVWYLLFQETGATFSDKEWGFGYTNLGADTTIAMPPDSQDKAGKTLFVVFDYTDPIGDHQAVSRSVSVKLQTAVAP
jgi:hypothetical protein